MSSVDTAPPLLSLLHKIFKRNVTHFYNSKTKINKSHYFTNYYNKMTGI